MVDFMKTDKFKQNIEAQIAAERVSIDAQFFDYSVDEVDLIRCVIAGT